jgi:hypothetical protein
MGEMRNAFSILVGKPEGKRQLERSRHRWEDNISMDLWKIMWECVHCIRVAQGSYLEVV